MSICLIPNLSSKSKFKDTNRLVFSVNDKDLLKDDHIGSVSFKLGTFDGLKSGVYKLVSKRSALDEDPVLLEDCQDNIEEGIQRRHSIDSLSSKISNVQAARPPVDLKTLVKKLSDIAVLNDESGLSKFYK